MLCHSLQAGCWIEGPGWTQLLYYGLGSGSVHLLTPLPPPKKELKEHFRTRWYTVIFWYTRMWMHLCIRNALNMTGDDKDGNNWYIDEYRCKKKKKPSTDTANVKCISEIGWSFMRTLPCYRLINQNVITQMDILMWAWFQMTSVNTVSGCTLQHKVTSRTHPCRLNLFCCPPAPSPGLLQNNESRLNRDQTAFLLQASHCIPAKVCQTVAVTDELMSEK